MPRSTCSSPALVQPPLRAGRVVIASLLAACISTPAASAGEVTITRDGVTVAVNHDGVLVGTPREGLVTFDGPDVVVGPRVAEWSGVAYDVDGVHVEAVGAGLAPDWASPRRLNFEPVSLEGDGRRAAVVSQAGAMLVHTNFWFDPDGPYLMLAVTLENPTDRALGDVWYTREWSVAGTWTFPSDLPVPQPIADGVCRQAWMLGPLAPRQRVTVGMSYLPRGIPVAAGGVDVPLSLWTSPSWPNGLVIGPTNGISFGDYDADGYPDLFALEGGNLFRNVDGKDWVLAANLAAGLPNASRRYGSSFGDYDNDGRPDIGTEPREASSGDTCHHLLHNLGGTNFQDVTALPGIMSKACNSDAETICWGDTDGDGNLDMFLPVYPPWVTGPGNFFWHNLGPVGPGNAYAFAEISATAGLDNPPGTARPEGAQFVDTDFDGDIDLYCNGTLYLNESSLGAPLFAPMTTPGSGIQFSNSLEEGIVLHDADMDGDFDLTGVWSDPFIGVRIHQAWGDGSYRILAPTVVDSNGVGLNLGVSSEDWDNDGDMDLTTRQVFRRNMFMETGTFQYAVASHTIPSLHLTSATPAWGDFDKDGDLDCALGNWLSDGHFYENTLYGADTPQDQRRYVRVRVMRDSDRVPAGLETEYGAVVEIHIPGEKDAVRRKKFVSSSAGYLNQNEYTLHFGLPADPAPANPEVDLVFDVSVDLTGAAADGYARIDKHINPVLGNVRLAQLQDREIVVYRSGAVVLDGVRLAPQAPRPIHLTTSTDGLMRAVPTTQLPGMMAAAPDEYVGVEFDTLGATGPIRLKEILLDGQLSDPAACAEGATNLTLWDVTNPASPTVVSNGRLQRSTRSTNRRTYFDVNVLLPPGRVLRLVAGVSVLRPSPITAPVVTGPVRVTGGLRFTDVAPCTGAGVAAASIDPTQVYAAVRFSDQRESVADLGLGTGGALGVPQFSATGAAVAGTPISFQITGGPPNANGAIFLGLTVDPVKTQTGAVLVPTPEIVFPLALDATGGFAFSGPWPAALPPGVSMYLQLVAADPSAPAGLAFSNALAITSQP